MRAIPSAESLRERIKHHEAEAARLHRLRREASLPRIPTARNADMRDDRSELLTQAQAHDRAAKQLTGELSLAALVEEVLSHARVEHCQLTSLWVVQKPGLHPVLGTRGWRLDIRLTDGSCHEVTLTDARVTAEDIAVVIDEALSDGEESAG